MPQRYDEMFKKQIVRLRIEEGQSMKSIMEEYGISKSSIIKWCKEFREECQNNFSVRVQKSVFEALLGRKKYTRLIEESQRIIDPSTDSLRIYILDSIINVYTWGLGERKEEDCVIL